MRAFNSTDRVMTLSELARASNLPKSTVHRLLARLIELDAVEHHGDGYKVSLAMVQIGTTAPASIARDLSVPHLARLHQWTGYTVTVGVLRGFDVVHIEQVARPAWHHRLTRAGARLPATCTAMGKAMLAWADMDELADRLPRPLPVLTASSIRDVDEFLAQLPGVRQQNLARERQETLDGMAGVAAAVVVKGAAVAALSILHPLTDRLPPQADNALRDAAGQLARELEATVNTEGRARWFPDPYHAPEHLPRAHGGSDLI